jgi:hypothetical protein
MRNRTTIAKPAWAAHHHAMPAGRHHRGIARGLHIYLSIELRSRPSMNRLGNELTGHAVE